MSFCRTPDDYVWHRNGHGFGWSVKPPEWMKVEPGYLVRECQRCGSLVQEDAMGRRKA